MQEVCLKILRGEGVSPFENEDEHLDGVLYYVPDLWEEYLSNYINAAIRKDRRVNREDGYFSMEEQKKIYVMTDINGDDGHLTEPDYVSFYSLPVIIPKLNGTFDEWMRKSDDSIDRTVNLIMEILRHESQRNRLFIEALEQFRLNVQKSNLSMFDIDNALKNMWFNNE